MEMPADLQAALRENPTAQAVFEGLSPSHQREYLEWIEEARSYETRQKRIERTAMRLVGDH